MTRSRKPALVIWQHMSVSNKVYVSSSRLVVDWGIRCIGCHGQLSIKSGCKIAVINICWCHIAVTLSKLRSKPNNWTAAIRNTINAILRLADLEDGCVGWFRLLSDSFSVVITPDWGPAANTDFRSVLIRAGSPTDVARWNAVDVGIIQLWRRTRDDFDRPRCWRWWYVSSSAFSRRSRAASSCSSESPRDPLPPPRSDAELDSSWASSLDLAVARRRISSSSFCSFLTSLVSSFSARWRDLSRSLDLSADGVDDGLRTAAGGWRAAADAVAADPLWDLLRLCRTRSQSCTVRLNDSDSVDWTIESSTVLRGCLLPAAFDAERWIPPSPLSSTAGTQTLGLRCVWTVNHRGIPKPRGKMGHLSLPKQWEKFYCIE